jgi:hypothetical protein
VALSYPRERWFVRAGVSVENLIRRLKSDTFQTYVHPVVEMHRVLTDAGLSLVEQHRTAAWSADVYARR